MRKTVGVGPGDTRDHQLCPKAHQNPLTQADLQCFIPKLTTNAMNISNISNPDYLNFTDPNYCKNPLVAMGKLDKDSGKFLPYAFCDTCHIDRCDKYSSKLHKVMERDLESKDEKVQKKMKEIRDMFQCVCTTTCCYRHLFRDPADAKTYNVVQYFHFRHLGIDVEIHNCPV